MNPRLSPWGGSLLCFLCLSHCSLVPFHVPRSITSHPTSLVLFDLTVFLILPNQTDLYQPCSLRFPFCCTQPILPPLFLFLFLFVLILSPGFLGCKWQTPGVVQSSKKPCCYHLEINPSMCQCLYSNSVGHKMFNSTGAYLSLCEKRRKVRRCREKLE